MNLIDARRAARRALVRPVLALLDLVLPPRCPGCRSIVATDRSFCLACWNALVFITAPLCACCGAPFVHDRGPGAQCGQCLAAPPRFTAARAALVYDGPAREVLLGFKHADRQHLAHVMAPHLVRAAAAHLRPGALLVPVPLHWTRLWRRGFNQAALLAQAVGRLAAVEIAVDALIRVKATRLSKGLGRKARADNVRGAFRVRRREAVSGRDIVLVDDVLTTGATADACARHLRRAGARSVTVLTWARVVRDVG